MNLIKMVYSGMGSDTEAQTHESIHLSYFDFISYQIINIYVARYPSTHTDINTYRSYISVVVSNNTVQFLPST